MAEMNPSPHDTPVVKSTDEARAGVTGHQVRYVLGFGLGGAILALLVLSLYFGFGGH
jgi:hypothetical protein